MPKQEYKILEFHGGTNNKFDPRDIAENQNSLSQMSVSKPGRLVMEGSFKTLKSDTNLAGHSITTPVGTSGFEEGYGLHSFSHDYDLEGQLVDTNFIVLNDSEEIDIYDPNKATPGWYSSKFKLGSRAFSVKSHYYNIDGALRACDLDFSVKTTTETTSGTPADATLKSNNQYDRILTTSSGSFDTGDIIQINQELIYVVSGSATGTEISVIRGFAGTKASDHANGSTIYYVNIPRYFGHIKQDRLFECESSDSINTWTLDVQTPEPPNDTRSGTNFETSEELVQDGSIAEANVGASAGWAVATGWSYDATPDELAYNGSTDDALLTHTFSSSLKLGSHYVFRFTVETASLQLTFKDSADNVLIAKTTYAVGTHHVNLVPVADTATLKILADADGAAAEIVGSTPVSCKQLEYISSSTQSLRIYENIEASTSGFPSESEKVVLEFGTKNPDFGITQIAYSASLAQGNFTITTSGFGSSSTAGHGLKAGQTVFLEGLVSASIALSGEHEVLSTPTSTTFTIEVEGADSDDNSDYATDAIYVEDVTSFAKNVSYDNNITITINDSDMPALAQTSSFYVHITGQTGVTDYNGVKLATPISGGSNNDFRITTSQEDSTGSAAGTTYVQQLVGVVSTSGNSINEDLKRKWNFAMSFTYDGPGQEVQESLLAQGYKIEAMDGADGTALLLAESGFDSTEVDLTVDSNNGAMFSVGDVIMLDSEQMYVSAISTDVLTVTRAYNGTTGASHADDVQIYKISKLTTTATVDWANFDFAPSCVIKFLYNHAKSGTSTWNPRINGFKVYMKDVTENSFSEEWRLFSQVNFNKGTYQILASDDSELILEQPGTWASDYKISTLSSGTEVKIKPVDTYLSENLFTEDTIIDAQYKAVEVVGRRAYIGNIRQGGRTYPDRMLRTPVNRFDTFPETNYIDVAVGDGDSIIALKSFGDRLLQFKKDKVYVINVAGESEVLESEYNNAGITYASQVCKTMNGICWFNAAGLWLFDGKGVQNLTLQIEDTEYTITEGCVIGYDKNSDRVIYAPEMAEAGETKWYIYDLTLKSYKAYNQGLAPYSNSGINYYTNTVTDQDGNLIIGYTSADSVTEFNVYQWSNTARGDELRENDTYWKSKDIDLGSPGVRKKIYKVYVTYKCTGDSGANLEYATEGSGSFAAFSSTKSTNLTNGTFDDSSGAWKVAELKPSSSINNIKSIQFKVGRKYVFTSTNGLADGTATGGTTKTINLQSHADVSGDNDTYNGYNIGIYYGPGRYNVRKILDYTGSSKIATIDDGSVVADWTDYGYTDTPVSSTTKYKLGVTPSDFEINDITVVFRMKRVK